MSFINAENGEGTVVLWDSGTVAAGALITSPVLDLRRFGQVIIWTFNADAATRALGVAPYLTRETAFGGNMVSPGNAGTNAWQMCPIGGGYTTGMSGYSGAPPPFAVFSLAAAGASNGRMIICGR